MREQFCEGERRGLKSRHARRDLPLSAGMAERLRARRRDSYRGDTEPVFATLAGTELSRPNLAGRVLMPGGGRGAHHRCRRQEVCAVEQARTPPAVCRVDAKAFVRTYSRLSGGRTWPLQTSSSSPAFQNRWTWGYPDTPVAVTIERWLDHVQENEHAWVMLFRDSSGEAEIQAMRREVRVRAHEVIAAFVAEQAGPRLRPEQVAPTAEFLRSGLAGLALCGSTIRRCRSRSSWRSRRA